MITKINELIKSGNTEADYFHGNFVTSGNKEFKT